MSDWFRAFARESRMPAPAALDFELCLNELMSNVIRHAYGDDDSHALAITLERREDRISATLEDDAKPFDPTSFAGSGGRETVAGVAIGGWGIPIVRALASAVRYERGNGKNRTSIEMRVGEEGSAPPDGALSGKR